jgi:hypothetical protein
MKTRLYVEGDKSKAICLHCKQTVATTFQRRDVPFSDGKGSARDILVSVCDTCDTVLAIPAQSTPAIKEARTKATCPVEANLPAVYVDMLDLAAYAVDSNSTTNFRKTLITLYLHRFASGQYPKKALLTAHKAAQAQYKERRGTARRRLSMKVAPTIASAMQILVAETELSPTELLKAVIYQIHRDVMGGQEPELIRELSTLAAISI